MITLNEGQTEGYNKILAFLAGPAKYFILSGGPGTGKSHLINFMMQDLSKTYHTIASVTGSNKYTGVLFTATTNSAVDNLNNFTAFGDVRTIQSTLNLFVKNNELIQRHPTTLKNYIVVIDEYTLIDYTLFKYLDEATSKVILVGDADQLLAVKGMAHELRREPDHVLTKSERTSSVEIMNTINMFRHFVQGTEPDDLDIGTMTDVETISEDGFMDLIDDPDFSFKDSRIITHTNNKVIAINQAIRAARGLPDHFIEGERVILNRYVRRGTEAFKTDSEYTVQSLLSTFEDDAGRSHYRYAVLDMWGVEHIFTTDKFDLRALYCSTVYKAQGRSVDTIYVDLAGFPNNTSRSILTRALYVGVSRAKQKVIFIGDLSEKMLSLL